MISMLLLWTVLACASWPLASALRGQGPPRKIHLDLEDSWDPRMLELPKIIQSFYKSSRLLNKYRCMPLKSDVCKRFGYDVSYFPNPLQHSSEDQAVAALRGYRWAVESNCSTDLMFLLCLIHMPPCSADLSHPIYPCRSVCKNVRRSCKGLLDHSRQSWSEFIDLTCNDLPKTTNMSTLAYKHVVCSTPTNMPDLQTGKPYFSPLKQRTSDSPWTASMKIQNTSVCLHTPETCIHVQQRLPLRKSTFCQHQFDWVLGGVILDHGKADSRRLCFSVRVSIATYFRSVLSGGHVPYNQTLVVCTSKSRNCRKCLKPTVSTRISMAGLTFPKSDDHSVTAVIFKGNKQSPKRWHFKLQRAGRWAKKHQRGSLRCT